MKAAVCIALLGILVMVMSASRHSDVPFLETPGWQPLGTLLLRQDSRDTQGLLLKHSAGGSLYRYDLERQALTESSDEAWQRADGPIMDCGRQPPPPFPVMHIDGTTSRLVVGDKEVPTAGAVSLTLALSPTQRWVAVLSAQGPRREALLPFLGGGGANGQHYHQVLSLPGGTAPGASLRLHMGHGNANDSLLRPCWTADERHIVYTDMYFSSIAVITTQLPSIP